MTMQLAYLAASILFILGLRSLASPASARAGVRLAEIGMLAAVVGTLLHSQIVSYAWILAGLTLGSLIGLAMAVWVPMTAMPQRIAVSHAFGALAATLVGVEEFLRLGFELPVLTRAALGFEVLFGALTVTGSLMAFAKLQDLLPGRPLTWPGQNAVNLGLFALACGLLGLLIVHPGPEHFYPLLGLAALLGVLMVLPIGGADMPVVLSLLNSYAGLASAATGFALGNQVLIIAGALDGASGFVLSVLMCKAMNRSFANVLFGAFGQIAAGAEGAAGSVRPVSVEDAAVQLAYAREVIVVPGYGLAVAQAQQALREVAEQIESRGGHVVYAMHPVAGRMPGHMNVLLAEAHVAYDRLQDLEEVNPHFPDADVALVVGANDVVNPAAREDRGSPLYGMPILDADRARSTIVLKRSLAPGFAGVENPLFTLPSTGMLFGDARETLQSLAVEMKRA